MVKGELEETGGVARRPVVREPVDGKGGKLRCVGEETDELASGLLRYVERRE